MSELFQEAKKARVYMEEINVIDMTKPPPPKPNSFERLRAAYLQAKRERLVK